MKKIMFLIIGVLLLSGCTLSNQSALSNSEPELPLNNEVSFPIGKIVDLSNIGLKEISQTVFNQVDMVELNVSSNNLTGALPAEIRQLKYLRVLNASNNQMTGVPAELGQLAFLEVLDLSNNQLTGLPNELGNLKNLKTLNLSGNNYSTADLDIIIKGLPSNIVIIK